VGAGRAAAQELLVDRCYAILLAGTQVGYLHERTTAEADGSLRTEILQQMAVRRYGQIFAVVQEDTWLEDSGLRSLRSLLDTNGQRQSLELRRVPSGLELRLERGGRESTLSLDAPGPVLGPALAGRAVAALLRGGGSAPLDYLSFSPESLSLVRVEVRPLGEGELEDSRGDVHRGLLSEERSSALPEVATRQVHDAAGRLLYAHTPIGVPVEIVPAGPVAAAAEGARRRAAAPACEIAALGLGRTGLERLRGPAEAPRSVLLRFQGAALPLLRACVEQSARPGEAVQIMAGSTATVLELRLRRPDARGGGYQGAPEEPAPPAARTDAEGFLRDGFYLDLEDPRLGELLASCPGRQPQAAWLACLERLVHGHLRRKSLDWGFAGVSEILTARAGDCTEHAVLLAALLRRAGVPARLAYGFLLTEGGFLGHAWTEAWVDGAWRWLDASFPGGEPYALRLPLGAIDPAEPLGPQMGLTLLQLAGGVRGELVEARYDAPASPGQPE